MRGLFEVVMLNDTVVDGENPKHRARRDIMSTVESHMIASTKMIKDLEHRHDRHKSRPMTPLYNHVQTTVHTVLADPNASRLSLE
jgi:hypothetical protein